MLARPAGPIQKKRKSGTLKPLADLGLTNDVYRARSGWTRFSRATLCPVDILRLSKDREAPICVRARHRDYLQGLSTDLTDS